MKKIFYFLIMIILAASCTSKPETDTTQTAETVIEVQPQIEEWVIVDHKNKDFGSAPPDWLSKSAMEMEAMDEYKDYYIFIIDRTGRDLQGLELWAKGFIAGNEISRMISIRVENKFVGAAAGDQNMLETYMEQVIKNISEAELSGMRTEDQYWIKKMDKNNPKNFEYRYLFLITVPRSEIDTAIDRAFNSAAEKNKSKTEEENAARERVKEAFEEDGI